MTRGAFRHKLTRAERPARHNPALGPGCNTGRVSTKPAQSERPYYAPSTRVAGDWSAHIATTLDRAASVLEQLDAEQWAAPSMCENWAVRDVVGHIIWRTGTPTREMLRLGRSAILGGRFSPNRDIDRFAREVAEAPPEDLVQMMRDIADQKVHGLGRSGVTELTEAVVHAYDITEAIGLPLRLSPRSTSAVAIARAKVPFSLASRRLAQAEYFASDTRWHIGRGRRVEATAGEILMELFGRKRLG